MALEYQFNCPLPQGLHARPASLLEELARTFVSEIILLNQRTGISANCKSVLGLVGTEVRFQDPCLITFRGADAAEALARTAAFLTETFPHCDDAPEPAAVPLRERPLPPCLRAAKVTLWRGQAVVPGIGEGRVIHLSGFKLPQELPAGEVSEPQAELLRIEAGLERLLQDYDRQVAAGRGLEAELLKAHRAMARDLDFQGLLRAAVLERRRTAAGAIAEAEAHFRGLLSASTNARLRERALDIQDVCCRLLRQVYGRAAGTADFRLEHDAIVIAESLLPSQFLALDRNYFKGLVLGQAGVTSHTVILARSFGIPTLTGVSAAPGGRLEGQEAVLDAGLGALVTHLDEVARRYYALETQRLRARQTRLHAFAAKPAATRDGHRLETSANVVSADEARAVFAAGAEGIGLFRTEMLFLDRDSPPDEAEQFDEYRRVAEAAGTRTVTVRTFDAGGDKPIPYLNLPPEANPFLGYRGARLYPAFEGLFRTQLRALVRASAFGRLRVMLPMVSTLGEVRWARQVLREEQARCAAEGLAADSSLLFGAMLEVPAAVFALELLCAELDFFSIGSNDLLQYFMAADRGNARVAGLCSPLQPAFLRFLRQLIETVHAEGKSVGLCGEMAAETRWLPLLAGLGLDSISVAALGIPTLKAELAAVTLADCQTLAAEALACATADEVAGLIDGFDARGSAPLLDPGLMLRGIEARSKEEAIHQAVARLYVLGRTEDPLAVEQSVWERETTYSTGFGHGFAIPHCKTNSVRANSLVLVRLQQPVAWGSVDGEPVRLFILLAVREKDAATEHMKLLARLSRRLMHEEFRARLEHEPDPDALCALLRETVQGRD